MGIAKRTLKSDGLLLLTAVIWGFAFSAQRSGMAHIGPFAFNAVRLALGALTLLPFLLAGRRRRTATAKARACPGLNKTAWVMLAGAVLFLGSSLQQIGIVTTTAGNAGFITCLYVVIVPLLGFFFGKSSSLRIWAGAVIALVGLYILSIGTGFTMAPGDLLELAGALFWAFHILIVGRLANRMEALELAVGQYAVCAGLSLVAALVFEPRPFAGAPSAALPILYGGIMSTGVAFTLQIVAQRTAHPAHASIILSLEALFAGLGGIILLGEPVTGRFVGGGLLMLAGMIVSQLEPAPPARARALAAAERAKQR